MEKIPKNLFFITRLQKIPKKYHNFSKLPRKEKISLLALYELADGRDVKVRVKDLNENIVKFQNFTDVQLNFRLTKRAMELGLM